MLIAFSCKNDSTSEMDQVAAKTENKAKNHPANSIGKKLPRDSKNQVSSGGMDWMTIEEAEKIENIEGKKYLVDVYTDWCGWCKVMDKKTFSDPKMKKYLEENFHVIKFNAEQKSPINFKGKKYEWVPSGKKGVNRLAIELLGSRLSYPTIVYLDENMNKIKSSPGFKDVEKLMAELKTL